MKLDFLGHASLVLRSGDVALLFDPLLFGVHHEGLYDLYPPRQLHLDRLPSIDAVVITHAHRDHFDLESIARLDRSTPIFAADDPLLLGCLTGLGFEQVQPLANWAPITAGAATLTPTPPADGAIEHGFIVQEDGVTLWHLVDTFPSAATIAEVKRRFGAVDLLIAPWQPLQDATFPSGNPVVFPYEMYRAILANILQIAPRALIPGACGFRAIGPAAWTNHLIFPVTRARFLHDVAVAAPQLAGRTHVMEPGDALNLAPGVFAREQGLLDYCVADPADYRWEQLQFRPYELGHPVLEPRGDAFTREQCHAALADFFAELARAAEEDPEAYFWHRRWQVTRQYEVVFAGGDRAYWLLDLRGEAPQISEQRSPLALAHTVLPASLLIGLIAGTISWEYAVLSGELRQHDHTYRVDDAGLHLPPRRLVDPLARALGGHDAEEHHLALCVERLTAELEDAPVMRTDQGSRAPARDSAAVMGQILTALADAGLDLNKHGE